VAGWRRQPITTLGVGANLYRCQLYQHGVRRLSDLLGQGALATTPSTLAAFVAAYGFAAVLGATKETFARFGWSWIIVVRWRRGHWPSTLKDKMIFPFKVSEYTTEVCGLSRWLVNDSVVSLYFDALKCMQKCSN